MDVAAGTPLWPAEWTGVGTVALAAVTVAAIISTIIITLQDRKRADQRLAKEQKAAESRLKAQLAHSDQQIRQEREIAEARLQKERDLALKREQYEEAVAVHITEARINPETWGSRITTGPDQPIECPAVIVLNRGRYTITRLQAQLCTGGQSLLPYAKRELFSSLGQLPEKITAGLAGEGQDIWGDTLRPTDIGMRFSSDAITVRNLYGSYPIVRWRDRWGTWWEHQHGEVREITENEPWKP